MLGRISGVRPLEWLCTALIEFSRGVPTLLFIYFFFLVVPQFGIKLPPLWKIATPVAISAAGVVAEVLRSGVNAVPKGQTEAAVSLGMRKNSVFFKIVFPQALRYVVPALISEVVIVLKDTTFAYVVNYADLMQNAKVLISNYDALLSVYLVVAIIYILINYILNKISVACRKRKQDRTREEQISYGREQNYSKQSAGYRTRHVDKHFGELHVLKDINLSVKKGEVVVVIGPSGSGKFDPVPDHQPPGDH